MLSPKEVNCGNGYRYTVLTLSIKVQLRLKQREDILQLE